MDFAVSSEVMSPWRQCTPARGSIGQRSTATMAGDEDEANDEVPSGDVSSSDVQLFSAPVIRSRST